MSLVENKKIHLDFEIKDSFLSGMELFGDEVKSLRKSKASMLGAKIIIRNFQAFLIGLAISTYQIKKFEENKPTNRTIRLLLKKSELVKLNTIQNEKTFSLIPKKIFDNHGLLKLEFCLCKKKNKHDKREAIRKKDEKRILE